MTTLTMTAAAFNKTPRAVHAGVNSITANINTGATSASGATCIFFAKVPKGATILDVIETHTTGAATCPVDIGYDATTSAFITAGAQNSVLRSNVPANIPLSIPVAGTTVTSYVKIIGTYTPGTATASLIANLTVLYTMDK